MSLSKMDRTFPVASGKPRSASDANRAFALSVAGALRSGFGGQGAAVKRVAALTDANQRAVKNWFEARNAPSGLHLVALARHSDEILRLILSLAGRRDALVRLEVGRARAALSAAVSALDALDEG